MTTASLPPDPGTQARRPVRLKSLVLLAIHDQLAAGGFSLLQKQLAAKVGATRSGVSGALKRLSDAGQIERCRQDIRITPAGRVAVARLRP